MFEDIEKNDFNLNIQRYVDTSTEEEEINLKQLTQKMNETNASIKEGNKALFDMLGELTFCSNDIENDVKAFMSMFGEV